MVLSTRSLFTEAKMPEKTLKLRFLRGRAYDGKDYGPGQFHGDVADVAEPWALRFIAQGAAVLIPTEAPQAEKTPKPAKGKK